MITSELVLGLPDYEVTAVDECGGRVRIKARFLGAVSCPDCRGTKLRLKDRRQRCLRHESWGVRRCVLELETRKWLCRACGRSFWQRFPGIQPRLRATEPFRRSVCQKHFFTRRHGYASTFCDLKNHKVHDMVLGRSEASLESYLARLEGKDVVQVVCMDLAARYRALVKKHFPQARIVAAAFT